MLELEGFSLPLVLTLFIAHFLTLKNKEIPNQNRVYLTFKKYYAFKDKASLETSMKEIKKFASHYNKLINPEQETDAEIRKHIKLIAKLEINICFPFVLNIYNDYHNEVIDKKTLTGAF